MSFQIGDVVGDYKIIAVLGAGGMGKVYKVKNQISDRIDALKVLLPSLSDNQKQADRFIREIKVLASLNHPNIAGLRTAFRVEDQLLMLMEYIEGRSLEKEAEAGAVPIHDATDYIRQVLTALDYAHARGVIHRDIKPANIMLTPERVIKLMDFGIAKSTSDDKLTQTGAILGSLAYMSPEQVQGSGLDPRSDLYSVGICLYEFITGSRPFEGTNYQMMVAQLQRIPQEPMERLPGVPQAMNDVIMKSVEKDPAKRFQSAAEFSAALKEVAPAEQEMTSFQASQTMALSFPGELLETRKQTAVQVAPPSVEGPAAASPAPSVAKSAASNAPPAVPVAAPAPRSNFLLPAGIGVGVVAVLAVLFLVFHYPKKADTTSQVVTTQTPAFVSRPSGDMVLVEGGQALLGPQPKSITLAPFYIDKTEVSNQAYVDFCRATGHTPPTGIDQSPSENPVVNVAYDDARSFCSWAMKRLPTAEEWEKAARGPHGQLFPWGNSFDASFANVPRDESAASTAKLAPVTAYQNGRSFYGALNMMGNVWEWVDAVAPVPTGEEFRNYQRIFRNLSPPLAATDSFYFARGGSYKFPDANPAELISDPGSPLPARARKPDVGFRCAMDPN